MEAYQERVIEEKKELDSKIERLTTFIKSEKFDKLPEDEQKRMRWQAVTMELYSAALADRVENFTHDSNIR